MKICYLNHDTRINTGAGQFYNFFSQAVKKTIPGIGIDVLTSDNLLYPNKLKLILALPAIRKVIKNCDIVHALDGWPYGVIAAIASLGLRKKIVITAIGTGGVQPLYQPIKRWLLRWAYGKADKLLAVSNNTKKEILKIIPNLKIEVINHGVDFERFQKENSYKTAAENLQPYILSVAALKKRKGLEYSIEAFAAVADKFPKLKYLIVGNGSERENLESQIKKFGLEDRVRFLTNLHPDFLTSLYHKAELFILLPQDINKDMEGFGLVLLEAAAAGLPVVSAKESSAEDAVLDGKTGILVGHSDVAGAARAIEKILSTESLKHYFSEESKNFAKSRTWDHVAQSYKSIYNELTRS